MKYKQLKLSALLFLGLGLQGLHAQNLFLNQTNAAQTNYTLAEVQKILFSAGNLTVQKIDNTSFDYALSELNYLSFINYVSIKEFENQPQSQFFVYPNPVNNTLNLSNANKQGIISILNLEGRVLKTQKIDGKSNISIDVSNLTKGFYLCRYSNNLAIRTVKFIKQ